MVAPRDGDGDGLVYDGTLREMPVARLPSLPYGGSIDAVVANAAVGAQRRERYGMDRRMFPSYIDTMDDAERARYQADPFNAVTGSGLAGPGLIGVLSPAKDRRKRYGSTKAKVIESIKAMMPREIQVTADGTARIDDMTAAAEAVHQVFSLFPEAASALTALNFLSGTKAMGRHGGVNKGVMAHAGPNVRGGPDHVGVAVEVFPNNVRGSVNYAAATRSGRDAMFRVPLDEAYQRATYVSVIHELGHVLDIHRSAIETGKAQQAIDDVRADPSDSESSWRSWLRVFAPSSYRDPARLADWNDEWGQAQRGEAYRPSTYSAQSQSEWWAESFTAWFLQLHGIEYPKEMVETRLGRNKTDLRSYMDESGIEYKDAIDDIEEAAGIDDDFDGSVIWDFVFPEPEAESKAMPRDGDGDGLIDDGKPTERPLPRSLKAITQWAHDTYDFDHGALHAKVTDVRLADDGSIFIDGKIYGDQGVQPPPEPQSQRMGAPSGRLGWRPWNGKGPRPRKGEEEEGGKWTTDDGGRLLWVPPRNLVDSYFPDDPEAIGEFGRGFSPLPDGGWEVEHGLLQIDPFYRGQGFASAFNAHAEDEYRRRGFRQIHLDAAMTVGGYAWARAGYDWDWRDRTTEEAIKTIRTRLSRRIEDTDGPATLKTKAKRVLARMKDMKAKNFPTPFEIAALGEIGKRTMLGAEWPGVKMLTTAGTKALDRADLLDAVARAHARWSALPRPDTPMPDPIPDDYGAHDRDYDEPDGDVYYEILDQELGGMEAKALPRDGDGDGLVYDGTLREMPAVHMLIPDLNPPVHPLKKPWAVPRTGPIEDISGRPHPMRGQRHNVRARRNQLLDMGPGHVLTERVSHFRGERAARRALADMGSSKLTVGHDLVPVGIGGPIDLHVRLYSRPEFAEADAQRLDEILREHEIRPGTDPSPSARPRRGRSWGFDFPNSGRARALRNRPQRTPRRRIGDTEAPLAVAPPTAPPIRHRSAVSPIPMPRGPKRGLDPVRDRADQYGHANIEVEQKIWEMLSSRGGREVKVNVQRGFEDQATAIAQAIDQVTTAYPEVTSLIKEVLVGNDAHTGTSASEFGVTRVFTGNPFGVDSKDGNKLNAGLTLAFNALTVAMVATAIKNGQNVGPRATSTIQFANNTRLPQERLEARLAYATTIHELGHVLDIHRLFHEQPPSPAVMRYANPRPPRVPKDALPWQAILSPFSIIHDDGGTRFMGRYSPDAPHPSTYSHQDTAEWWAENFTADWLDLPVPKDSTLIHARLSVNKQDITETWKELGLEYKDVSPNGDTEPMSPDGDIPAWAEPIVETFDGSVIWLYVLDPEDDDAKSFDYLVEAKLDPTAVASLTPSRGYKKKKPVARGTTTKPPKSPAKPAAPNAGLHPQKPVSKPATRLAPGAHYHTAGKSEIDGDGDGLADDGTPREHPVAPRVRKRGKNADHMMRAHTRAAAMTPAYNPLYEGNRSDVTGDFSFRGLQPDQDLRGVVKDKVVKDVAAEMLAQAPKGYFASLGKEPIPKWLYTPTLPRPRSTSTDTANTMSGAEFGGYNGKDEEGIASMLAHAFTLQWATSASDHQPLSIAIQNALGDHFGDEPRGLPPVDPDYAYKTDLAEVQKSVDEIEASPFKQAIDLYVKAVYANTQRELAKHKIHTVDVWRGIGPDSGDNPDALNLPHAARADLRIEANPGSSWAVERNTAEFFADSNMGNGLLLHMQVPASQVWSTATTGPGALHESEVILHSTSGATVDAFGYESDQFGMTDAEWVAAVKKANPSTKDDSIPTLDIDTPGEDGEDWPKKQVKPRSRQAKALPHDGDGDGLVYDGTLREMPAPGQHAIMGSVEKPAISDWQRERIKRLRVLKADRRHLRDLDRFPPPKLHSHMFDGANLGGPFTWKAAQRVQAAGLVESFKNEHGRERWRLSDLGRAYLAEFPDEVPGVANVAAPDVMERLTEAIQPVTERPSAPATINPRREQAMRELGFAKDSLDMAGWRQGGRGSLDVYSDDGVQLPLVLHHSWLAKKALLAVIDPEQKLGFDGDPAGDMLEHKQRDEDDAIAEWADVPGRTIEEVNAALDEAADLLGDGDDHRFDTRGVLLSNEERRQRYGSTPAEVEAWLHDRFPREGEHMVADDIDIDQATAAAQAIDDVLNDFPEVASMVKQIALGHGRDYKGEQAGKTKEGVAMYGLGGQGEFGGWKGADTRWGAGVDEGDTIVEGSHIGIDLPSILEYADPDKKDHNGQTPRERTTVQMASRIASQHNVPLRAHLGTYAAVTHELGHLIDAHRTLAEDYVNGPDFIHTDQWGRGRWYEATGIELISKHWRTTQWGGVDPPWQFKEPTDYGKATADDLSEWWAESFAAWYMGLPTDINTGWIEHRLGRNRDFDIAEYWTTIGKEYKGYAIVDHDDNLIIDDFFGETDG